MKSVSYKAFKDGNGYINPGLIPTAYRRSGNATTWGMVIAGAFLLAAATFVCLLILAS